LNTKLHISIAEGIIDVEGDPEHVRQVYADFKDRLLDGAPTKLALKQEEPPADTDPEGKGKPKAKRRPPSKRAAGRDDDGSGMDANAPKLDKELDTSSLPAFYSQFEPKNLSEKILIFMKFLTETLGIASPVAPVFLMNAA
jgi:hypothetical protein